MYEEKKILPMLLKVYKYLFICVVKNFFFLILQGYHNQLSGLEESDEKQFYSSKNIQKLQENVLAEI